MPPELIGHQRPWSLLRRLAARGRVPAALLFVGPPNVGKTTAALALARHLFQAAETAHVLAHPDLLHVAPTEEAAWRPTVQDLLRRVHERPVAAPRRVVLLENLDRLSAAAASLLLKAIEDAPAFANFLLTAVIPDQVASTIRSRCLTIEFTPVPDAEIAEGLRARGITAARAQACAALSGGRPGLALRLAHDASARKEYRAWLRLCEGARVGRPKALPPASLEERAEEFLLFLQGVLRAPPSSAPLLRRARESAALLRQHVPAPLVLDYLLAPSP